MSEETKTAVKEEKKVVETKKESTTENVQEKAQTFDKPRRKERWGVAYIYSSFNNTFLHITDITGSETIILVSGGHVVRQGRLESGPAAAIKIVKKAADAAKEKGITGVHIRVRAPGGITGKNNPGPGSQAVIKQLSREGLQIGVIEEVTPIPYDGCSRKGRKKNLRK